MVGNNNPLRVLGTLPHRPLDSGKSDACFFVSDLFTIIITDVDRDMSTNMYIISKDSKMSTPRPLLRNLGQTRDFKRSFPVSQY